MSSTNRQRQGLTLRRLQACLAAALCLFLSFPAHSQPDDTDFPAMAALFASLDSQAERCLTALSNNNDQELPQDCGDFITSIDSELLANYLGRCRELKQWRDDYVTANREIQDIADNSDLQAVLDIEYYCGDLALQKRTEYIASAFSQLRQLQSMASGISGVDVNNRYRVYPQGGSALQPGAERIRQETEQLWQQLELENLRQQLRQGID